jgi:formylglycine-generating enzyme required for sulfatase activity
MRTGTPDGMAEIAGGTFRMGSDVHYPDERPAHDVTVDGFWIDRCTVTNADFAAFTPNERWMANIWQGEFPWQNRALDGFPGRAPVGSFYALPHHGTLLAHPAGAADRPQPPFREYGRHHRDRDVLCRLHLRAA